MLAVSVLLAALIHACVLVGLRWEAEREPVRETLLRLLLLASRDTAAVTEQPPVTAPIPAAPLPCTRSVASRSDPRPRVRPKRRRQRRPRRLPAAVVPREGSVASALAPLVREAISARPRYKINPEPPYPVVARRRRQEGVVLLSVRVDAAGRPEAVTIQASSGFSALDEAAVAAVENWEFEPGRLGGEPVASQVEVPIRFELDRE